MLARYDNNNNVSNISSVWQWNAFCEKEEGNILLYVNVLWICS